MSKSKNLHIFALLCNLAIVIFSIAGVVLTVFENNGDIGKSFTYFTFITGLISGVISCVAVLFHIKSIKCNKDCCPYAVYLLRFISATMALLTFIIVMTALLPTAKNPVTMVTGGDLYLHILIPVISVVCFILFEIEPKFRFRNTFAPLAVVGVYGISIIISIVVIYFVSGIENAEYFAPYPFFKIIPGMKNYGLNIAICAGVLAAAFLAAALVWCLNRIISSIIVGYEVQIGENKEETKSIEVNKKVTKKKTVKTKKKIEQKEPIEITSKYDNNRVYHISIYDHKIKNWKVKLANGERAIKITKTQQEAIDYAISLARNYGGSVRVHSRLGRIRKE